ncbi:MAG: hypothetical protein RI947_531 [Candidatus Parcubacteria bacterium]|jgi:general stress protein 26
MAFKHTNTRGTDYYLHSRKVTLRGSGKEQTIYFFAKKPGEGSLEAVPSEYMVVESKKTGLPVLKRK